MCTRVENIGIQSAPCWEGPAQERSSNLPPFWTTILDISELKGRMQKGGTCGQPCGCAGRAALCTCCGSDLHDASHAATAGLCVLGLLQVGFCSRQSPPREVRKEGEGTGTNLALDFSFSGCSLQLPTDLALSSTESHANMSTSAQHLTVPWLLQVRHQVTWWRDSLPLRVPLQKVLGILSCHERILSRFTRDFGYKETNLCEIVYSYMLIGKVDKHGLCLLSLHYWDMFSGMCWEGGKFVFLPAIDCFLCPRICRSQKEGHNVNTFWVHRWYRIVKRSFNYMVFYFFNLRPCAQVSPKFMNFISKANLMFFKQSILLCCTQRAWQEAEQRTAVLFLRWATSREAHFGVATELVPVVTRSIVAIYGFNFFQCSRLRPPFIS